MQFSKLLAFAVLAPFCVADTIVNTPGSGSTGTFQAFPSNFGVNGESGTPYWANPSIDGPLRNIGYFLTNTGNTFPAPTPGLTSPKWFGNNDGTAAPSFYFTSTTASAISVSLIYTGDQLEFGWYDITNPANLHALFTTSAPTGSTSSFAPGVGTNYGFYMRYLSTSPGTPFDVFYTQDPLNSSGVGSERAAIGAPHQHFAVFSSDSAGAQPYYIGAEGGWGISGLERQGDYQDFVVKLAAVPEPRSMGLAGLALLTLGGGLKRLRRGR